MDYLSQLNKKWNEQRPDLDYHTMLSVGRILRCAFFIIEGTDKIVSQSGLSRAEFEIIAAVRGTGRNLRASELSAMTQASCAAITKRLDKLTRLGLIARKQLPSDRRVVLVALTPEGEAVVDDLVPQVLEYERSLLKTFSESEVQELENLIERLMHVVEPNRI